MKKKGFFKNIVEHWKKIGLIKARNKTALHENHFWLGFIGLLAVVVIAIAVFYIAVFGSISHTASIILKEHPEIIQSLNGDDQALMGSILKQIPVSVDFEGDFRGKFTNKTERYLEQEDLTCKENFTHESISTDASYLTRHMMFERDCSMYRVDSEREYYICPTDDCKKVERTREVADEFIPTSIQISRISIKTGR